jgi:hypothetical protein
MGVSGWPPSNFCSEKSSVPAGEDNQALGGRTRSFVAHYRELTRSQLRELKILDPKRCPGSRRHRVFGEGDRRSRTKMPYSDRRLNSFTT